MTEKGNPNTKLLSRVSEVRVVFQLLSNFKYSWHKFSSSSLNNKYQTWTHIAYN